RHPQGAEQAKTGGPLPADTRALSETRGRGALPASPADDRTGLRPDQEQPASGALLKTRLSQLQGRMAPHRRHTQPAEALSQRSGAGAGLKRGHSLGGGFRGTTLGPVDTTLRDTLHGKERPPAPQSRSLRVGNSPLSRKSGCD